jgi:hypothetical protein
MTKTKKVRTFEQLNSILRTRGQEPEELGIRTGWGAKFARVYGNVYVRSSPSARYLQLVRNPGKTPEDGYMDIATVTSVAGGDTLYTVVGCGRGTSKPRHRNYRLTWRRLARRLTPYDGLKCKGEWRYRVRQDGRFECLPPATPAPRPSLLYPSSLLPQGPTAWVSGYARVSQYPNFIDRAKRFARALRVAVDGRFGARLQLLWNAHAATFQPTQEQAVWLHVCLQPHDNRDAKRLLIAIAMHDQISRKFFRISGDYSKRHCQFLATDLDTDASRVQWPYQYRWKCKADALAGIKEWLLGSLYIPGPDF